MGNPVKVLREMRAARRARRDVSAEAARSRARSIPRRVGRAAFFAAALLLACVPAALRASAATYLPPLALLLALAVSGLWLAATRRRVEVEVEAPSVTARRGGTAPFVIRMRNRGLLPVPRVEAECYVTDLFGGVESTTSVAASLGPRAVSEMMVDVRLPHLGTFSAGVSRAVAFDLIGAFSADVPLEGAEAAVVVTPLDAGVGEPDLDVTASDDTRIMFKPVLSDDQDYAGVRDYAYGDPMKTVHWNLTARDAGGRMYTRLYESNATPSLCIVVDGGAAAYGADGLMAVLDGSVEAAVSLFKASSEEGIDTELVYPSARGGSCPWRGRDEAALVADVRRPDPSGIGGVDALESLAAACMSTHGAGNVCWVSSRIPQEAVETLAAFRMRRRHPMAVLVVPSGLDGPDAELAESARRQLRRLSASGVPWRVAVSGEYGTSIEGVAL